MKISTRHRYIAKIPASEVTAEGQKNEALSLIVYCHGWQSAKELSLTQARKLAYEGFRIILPDTMNHGERKTGPISTVPSITFWSSIQYNLIEFSVIIHHSHKLGLIKENWIGVGGIPMDGITTSALMTQHPEIQAATRLVRTPYPTRYIQRVIQQAKEFAIFMPKDLPLLLSQVHQCDLLQTPEGLQERPTLFWHGTKDEKIPCEDMADFEQLVSGKTYARSARSITEIGERRLVRGETVGLVVDFSKEASKTLEK